MVFATMLHGVPPHGFRSPSSQCRFLPRPMKQYPLRLANPSIDPAWFNRVRHSTHDCVVMEGGSICLDGVLLLFAGESAPDGSPVRVSCSGNFYCIAAGACSDAVPNPAKLRPDRRRDLAAAFNARIHFPVIWDVSHRRVVSGLSKSSNGDGLFSRSVEHFLVLEPFSSGRLRRVPGQILCSNRSDNLDLSCDVDGDGSLYQPRVLRDRIDVAPMTE